MAEYKLETDEDGNTVECDNCGYAAPVRTFNTIPGRPRTYCEICAKSFLSDATTFPQDCPDTKLYKSIGAVANLILHKITGKPGG